MKSLPPNESSLASNPGFPFQINIGFTTLEAMLASFPGPVGLIPSPCWTHSHTVLLVYCK